MQLALDPDDESAEYDELSPFDQAGAEPRAPGSPDGDVTGERQNPHNPDPQLPSCKKKGKNEPDGCHGPR